MDAQRTIKDAAKVKNEKLYTEIHHLDLIAKEFKVHQHCYQNFTRGFSKGATSTVTSDAQYDKRDFEVVKDFISNEVICCRKAVSMKYLHYIYGLFPEDSRYRNKLKERIKKQYGDRLLFLQPSNGKGEKLLPSKQSAPTMTCRGRLFSWKKFF